MQEASLTQKIVIRGKLLVESPLLIGAGGETGGRIHEVDTSVLKDENERPYIPGTSLAGVLRAWMYEWGAEDAELIFGRVEKQTKGERDLQSAIDIADVPLAEAHLVVRDGVSIDSFTGTGLKGHKYNYEAVERGAMGPLDIVITLRAFHETKNKDLRMLVTRLTDHLCTGIQLGALTAKGFGRVVCEAPVAEFYDFRQAEMVKAWLLGEPSSDRYHGQVEECTLKDTLTIDADFALRTSLLVRSQEISEDEKKNKIRAVQMRSGGDYLIPGTTLKGVLRHQAEEILRSLEKPTACLDKLMGYATKKSSQRSRFFVKEVYFQNGVVEKGQTRNRIDRFTGGTIESALFTNKAIWQEKKGHKVMKIHFEIHQCKEWEAGLALFLLKDLWTGRIAVGGEKSIGRGTLQGLAADISFEGNKYKLGENGKILQGNPEELEAYVKTLQEYTGEGEKV